MLSRFFKNNRHMIETWQPYIIILKDLKSMSCYNRDYSCWNMYMSNSSRCNIYCPSMSNIKRCINGIVVLMVWLVLMGIMNLASKRKVRWMYWVPRSIHRGGNTIVSVIKRTIKIISNDRHFLSSFS